MKKLRNMCENHESYLTERMRWTLIVKDERQNIDRIYLNQTSKGTMQTEQDQIYSVCNKAKYTLIMERDVYCTLCKKWIGEEVGDGYESETDYDAIMKQHREFINQQVKNANNAVKNGKLSEYVKWIIENNPEPFHNKKQRKNV